LSPSKKPQILLTAIVTVLIFAYSNVRAAGAVQQSATALQTDKSISVLTAIDLLPEAGPDKQRIENTSRMVGRQSIYRLHKRVDTLRWLEDFIVRANDFMNDHPDSTNSMHVIIGDAYHWIGHILEDTGKPRSAAVAYWDSFKSYQLSNSVSSVGINNLVTRSHAAVHLQRLFRSYAVPIPSEVDGFSADRVSLFVSERIKQLEIYEATVDRINSAPLPSQLSCSAIMGLRAGH
jgi:hypothetical protein